MTRDQHGDQALVAQGADHTREGHRRERTDGRTPCQTETTMRGPQGIAGHGRAHLAVAQDEVRQDGEHRLAGGALEAPDGKTPQTDPRILGVAREAPALTAAGLVEELKTEGEEEGEDACDKRSWARSRHGEGNTLKDQVYGARLGAPPLNSLECG